MSIHHSNRFSNITKVKYFLPSQRPNSNTRQAKSYIQSRAPTRKQSTIEENDQTEQPVNLKNITKDDISFEVLGVSDINNEQKQQQSSVKKTSDKKIFSMFPEGKQKQEFLKFVDGLKQDQNYQNTITMFTIMYYYQKKTGQKIENLL